MARLKLSEYRAKYILNTILTLPYIGWSDADNTLNLRTKEKYVVKVDQAVKGRYKKGLVKLGVSGSEVKSVMSELKNEGYTSFIIEPYVTYDRSNERYIALNYNRSGYYFTYSVNGGVDIEHNKETLKTFFENESLNWQELANLTGFSSQNLQDLLKLFKDNFFVSLEINPYIIEKGVVRILDAAIEIDDAGQYFTDIWNDHDIRSPKTHKLTDSEKNVLALNTVSPASFNLNILNPNGSIFLLLSGGGASIVIADEVYNIGLGHELANYGEYSGNPTIDETYTYTKQLLDIMLLSNSPKKVLFIGGAVANFTDIANTFTGIIAAFDQYADALKQQKVFVFVRRGGPNQEIGLEKMQTALERHGILGGVYGPKVSITDALQNALKDYK